MIQVGDMTLGKDMAGFIVEDKRKPKKISWQLHPVIYKVFNANGEGLYSNGIPPQIAAGEYAALPLLPLGDTQETLISAAMDNIYSKSAGKNALDESIKILFQSDTPSAAIGK